MGLLARATREIREERRAESVHGGLGLVMFDEGQARSLVSAFPDRSDILAIRCGPVGGSMSAEMLSRLAAILERALGPTARIYATTTGICAFSQPRGDWDPELYTSLLERLLPSHATAVPGGLEILAKRFARHAPKIGEGLLGFARG